MPHLKKKASLYIQFILKSHLTIFSFLVQQIRRDMDKNSSLFQTYLAMKSNLFTVNSFLKKLTIRISPGIPKQVWEILFESFQETARRAKDLIASLGKNEDAPENCLARNRRDMMEFAVRGPLCISGEELCGLLQRTDRAVSMKLLSALHKEREAWG